MTPFTAIESRAAFLDEENIDTDAIYPARFLLLMDRDGLGPYLFRDRRFTGDELRNDRFILDREPFNKAQVLIAGAGFGCGSSREQAVWALTGFGIRCVIAPDFGEIFAGNALKNGLLTLRLAPDVVRRLGEAALQGASVRIDLEVQTVSMNGEHIAKIDIDGHHRDALLNGWDEADIMLREDGAAIADFELRHRAVQPWLFAKGE